LKLPVLTKYENICEKIYDQVWVLFRISINTLASGRFRGFSRQNNRIVRGLRARNSGANWGRELFKRSKDSASLLVCTRKKTFVSGWGFFVSDVISRGLLGHLGLLHLVLGSNC